MRTAEADEPDRIAAQRERQTISAAVNPAKGTVAGFPIIHAHIFENYRFVQIHRQAVFEL